MKPPSWLLEKLSPCFRVRLLKLCPPPPQYGFVHMVSHLDRGISKFLHLKNGRSRLVFTRRVQSKLRIQRVKGKTLGWRRLVEHHKHFKGKKKQMSNLGEG